MAKLSDKMKAFCRAYVARKGNISAAARDSEYSQRHGYQLMHSPEVLDHIAELQLIACAAANVSAEEVVEEAKALAFSDITNILTIEAGELILRGDLHNLPREVRVTIKALEIKETSVKIKGQDDAELVRRTYKITLHDKIEPLKLLAIYTSAVVGGKPGTPLEGEETWTGVEILPPPTPEARRLSYAKEPEDR